MWPHSIVVGIDGFAICVGSDSNEVIDRLQPWAIDVVSDIADYALELSPESSTEISGLRRLPRLMHGTCDVIRLRDIEALSEALMRVLGSFKKLDGDGLLRIGLVPVVSGDRAVLIPIEQVGRMSRRWFAKHGVEPLYGISSVIDVEEMTVTPEAALGGGRGLSEHSYSLHEWWLSSTDPSVGLGNGEAVAQTMRYTNPRSPKEAQRVLELAATLVRQQRPSLVLAAPDHIMEQVDPETAADVLRAVETKLTTALTE